MLLFHTVFTELTLK